MTADRMFAPGDIVLAAFPYSDLSGSKFRPALVVSRLFGNDYFLAFMTRQSRVFDPQAEYVVDVTHPDYPSSGLKGPAVIRLSKIMSLDRSVIRGRLGYLSPETMRPIKQAMRYVLDL